MARRGEMTIRQVKLAIRIIFCLLSYFEKLIVGLSNVEESTQFLVVHSS